MSGSHPQNVQSEEGFNFALYLNQPQLNREPSFNDRERVQMELNLDTASSLNEFERISKNSKLKNFIPKDLAKNLDNFSQLSAGSHINALTLNELESDKKNEDFTDLISPINIGHHKQFKLNAFDGGVKEENAIDFASPANQNGKTFVEFSNPMHAQYINFQNEKANKGEININYYANQINISNSNNFYNPNNYNMSNFENKNKISNKGVGSEFGQQYGMNPNLMDMNYGGMYQGQINGYYPQDPYQNLQSNNQFYNPNVYSNQQVDPIQMQSGAYFPFNKTYQNFQNQPKQMTQNTKDQMQNNQKGNENSKKKRHFAERQGDWVCMKCKNLNFSFRVVCNRCQLPKAESEELYASSMKNMKGQNEMPQGRQMNNPYVNAPYINSNNTQGLNQGGSILNGNMNWSNKHGNQQSYQGMNNNQF